MKNICIFYTDITHAAGIERVLSILSNELCDFQHINLTIVSLYKSNINTSYFFNNKINIIYLNERGYGEKPKSLKRLYSQLLQIGRVHNFFKKNNFDYILSQTFPMTAILYFAKVPSQKIISVEHVYWGYYKGLINKFRLHIYRQIKHLVVLTQKDKTYFSKQNIPTTVIPNPLKMVETKEPNLSSKRIISVARLEWQKGFDRLIPLFKDIFNKYPDWTLDIYGKGTEELKLRNLIENLNLTNNIKLKGITTNIETELNSSSFFVLASRFEGFGMVLVEAMQQGIPCISYDCPNGPSDIITHNKDGFLIKENDTENYKKSIIKLIENYELRQEMGRNAKQKVHKFDSRIIATKWINLLSNQ